MIYLDYAAATPVDEAVLRAAQPYFSELFYNPSARYLPAKHVKQEIDTARKTISSWLGCRAEEVFFTAGGTEANNLAIHGVMSQYPEANCVISAIEHDSVHAPAQEYAARELPVTSDGLVNPANIEKYVDDKTVLLSIGYVNSEIGTIQPLKEIAAAVKNIRKARQKSGNDLPLYFHADACQAANYLDLHVHTLGVDMLTINGGKIYGFKQSGCLYISREIVLSAVIKGGGQERGVRSGTENVAFSIGLAKALDMAQQIRYEESKRLMQLRDMFITKITEHFPDAVINGSLKHRIANNIHVTFPGKSNEVLQLQLEQVEVLVATGSACRAAKVGAPSRVLKAIGKTDDEAAASLRITLGRSTTQSDIETTLKKLQQIILKN